MPFSFFHAANACHASPLTPTTWAPAASNCGSAASKPATSFVQVGVKAATKVYSTTGPLAGRSPSLTGLPSGPFSTKSGACCPTSSASAEGASATPRSTAPTTATSVRPIRMTGLLRKVGWKVSAGRDSTPSAAAASDGDVAVDLWERHERSKDALQELRRLDV